MSYIYFVVVVENVISILHKIVAAVWFENTGERERRFERRRELRRLRQSGESVVVREGRLERRREQGRRHLANESADYRIEPYGRC